MEAANKALQNISLANLFYHADAEDDIGLFSREAIARLLGPIPYTYIAGSEFKPYLLQGLSHFSPDVRKLSLNQAQKCLRNEEEIKMMVSLTYAYRHRGNAFAECSDRSNLRFS